VNCGPSFPAPYAGPVPWKTTTSVGVPVGAKVISVTSRSVCVTTKVWSITLLCVTALEPVPNILVAENLTVISVPAATLPPTLSSLTNGLAGSG
jgi:hypothetical protein